MSENLVSYRKLGGWLMLFNVLTIASVSLMLLSLINSILSWKLIMSMGLVNPKDMIITLFLNTIVSIFYILSLVCLFKRKRNFKVFFIISSLILIILNSISIIIDIQVIGSIINIISNLFSVVYFLVWLIYFNKSDRVKVYLMDEQEYKDKRMQLSNQL